MNREIKFRAWASDTKEMIPWEEFMVEWFEDDEITMMQYTGLRDKNSKEIYEGDILRVTDENKKIIIGAVNYAESFAGYAYSDESWNYRLSATAEFFREVIGNIYKNSKTNAKP